MKTFYTFLALLLSLNSFAQIAPDFTLTDINGETHNLYDYLDAGTTVILDFYAVWCNPCQINAPGVEEVYLEFGPEGTNEIMILGIEGDDDSTDGEVAQYAIDYDCSNPQINVSEGVMDLYDIEYYPTYLVVCPDRSYAEYEGISPEEIEVALSIGVELCEEFEGHDVDARLFAYNSGTTLCANETTPNITLMNMGAENLVSVDIKAYVNGELQSTTNWTGNLGLYDFDFVSLPLIDMSSFTDPSINIVIENPNEVVDENLSNDEISVDIEYGGTSYVSDYIRFELYFDNFPQETTWDFKNSIGEVIISGQDYIGFPNFSPPIDTIINMPINDCYTFTIYDSFGDGICCNYADPGEGFWTISTSDATIIAEGGVFTDQESAIFGIDNPSGVAVEEFSMEQVNIFPNPAVNSFTVSALSYSYVWNLYSTDGRLILNGVSKAMENNTIDITAIQASGNYIFSLESEKGTVHKMIFIEK